MSKKMNGKTGFSQKDIVNWSDSLGISKSDYGEYFLIKKLNDVKPKVYWQTSELSLIGNLFQFAIIFASRKRKKSETVKDEAKYVLKINY